MHKKPRDEKNELLQEYELTLERFANGLENYNKDLGKKHPDHRQETHPHQKP